MNTGWRELSKKQQKNNINVLINSIKLDILTWESMGLMKFEGQPQVAIRGTAVFFVLGVNFAVQMLRLLLGHDFIFFVEVINGYQYPY